MNIFKEAKDILYRKYCWVHEMQDKRHKISVILSDDEANKIYETLRKAEQLQWLLKLEMELKELEIEIRRLQKINNEYVPPLDDYINDEKLRKNYLEDRIKILRKQLFGEQEVVE